MPIDNRARQRTLNLTHLVALLQVLQLRGGAHLTQAAEPIEDFALELQVLPQHQLLGVVEGEVALQLHLLETQLLLLGDDGLLDPLLALKAGFVVEPQQHLTLVHPLPLLDQQALEHTADRHLDGLDVSDGLQLAGGHHHLFGLGEGEPGESEGGGAHQEPGDGAGQPGRLLQHHLLVTRTHLALELVLGRPDQGLPAAHKTAHQLTSCWR